MFPSEASPMRRRFASMSLRRIVPLLATAVAGTLSAFVAAGPAHAALPDRFGFVLYDGAGPVASSTYPSSTTVVGTAGHYQVRFPGQGASGGVVHVTAVSLAPRWC